MSRLLRSGVLLIAILLRVFFVPPHVAHAEFDTSAGEEGLGAYEEYKGQQEPRAEKATDRVDKDEVRHHPYHVGTESILTPIENWLFDMGVILNEATYDECMEYEIIGVCLTIIGNLIVPTPYVRYYGPFQKGEEVPQPYRTGYIWRKILEPLKDESLTKYYTEFMPEVAQREIQYGTDFSIDYLNRALDMDLERLTVPTIGPEVPLAAEEAVGDKNNRLGEAGPYQDGYVYNEYHLMPGAPSDYGSMKIPKNVLPIWSELGWCHVQKTPGFWYSEFPENRVYSRISEMSLLLFPTEMSVLRGNPFTCMNFNRVSKGGRTPDELADIVPGGSSELVGAPCQGINQGLWIPVTNMMHTMYQTTAAALGLTKSKTAFKISPDTYYDITPSEDKVQWIRNERMDGKENVINESTKKCDKLAKWVLDYDDGNLKIGPDEKKDHWNVLAHWRKIRCCPKGGVPIIVWKDGETLTPIVQ